MDRARREADGGRVIHRRGRVNYQVVVALVVQNVLVASCLLLSLYVYYSIHWAAEVPVSLCACVSVYVFLFVCACVSVCLCVCVNA